VTLLRVSWHPIRYRLLLMFSLVLPAGCAGASPSGNVEDRAPPLQGGSTATVGGAPVSSGTSSVGGTAPAVGGGGVGGSSSAGTAGASGEAAAGQGGSGGANSTGGAPVGGTGSPGWVGTWVTSQQLTEPANLPPSPGLTESSLRQVVRVSIGGKRLRVRFSNEYGTAPVTLKKVHCAVSSGGSSITAATDRELAFQGAASVTIPAKAAVFSDAFDFSLAPLSALAVSIQFGATSSDVTGHPGSRTTSYLQAGDAVAAASFSSAATADHWYVLSGIDVMAESSSHAVVILGDSITDGRGSTTNGNDRWTDALAERLQNNAGTSAVGVLNQGIGGNAVLSGGLGPPATARFEADVLKQSGVRWLIVFEGVNDIGDGATASALIAAYQQFVSKARGAGLLAFGATILPFKGNVYYSADHEAARTTVNEWIRQPGNFDATIDLDAAVRDPANPDTLLAAYDSNDHLHLNPAGYKKLAEAINLMRFEDNALNAFAPGRLP
jgi:lysophospholipase L1-like esterase